MTAPAEPEDVRPVRRAAARGGPRARRGAVRGRPLAGQARPAAERPPAVVSFTFGCPEEAVVTALREAGSEVWVTVTGPEEARLAQWAGATALVAQGIEAGGHRGSFADRGDLGPAGAAGPAGRPGQPRCRWWPRAGSPPRRRWRPCWPPGPGRRRWARRSCAAPRPGTAEAHRAGAGGARGHRASPARSAASPPEASENRFLREHPDAPERLPGAAPRDRAHPCRRPRAR